MIMQVTIFHNPNCPQSRKLLEDIRARGVEPKVIEYLGAPLSPQKLRHLIKDTLHVRVRDVVRTGEPLYAAFGYIAPTVGALLQEGIDVAVIFNALRASWGTVPSSESEEE